MPRPPSQQPTIMMPAARQSEPEIEVVFDDDRDPNGELPTAPLPPAPDSATVRPPGSELDSLRAASRTGLAWLSEPLMAYDRERGSWVLAEPYSASQRDLHGNTFLVECQAGLVVPDLGDPMELRAEVVAAQLRRSITAAQVVPFTSDEGVSVGPRWRLVIVQAFREADRGERPRG